jgi:hypothetical protein
VAHRHVKTSTGAAFMRIHRIVAVVAILLVGFGVKMFVFSSPAAKAQLEPNKGMNVLQMMIEYPIKSLPTVPDLENPV